MSIYDDKPRKGKATPGTQRVIKLKRSGAHVGYSDVNGIATLVDTVAEAGDRISFGYTSNGDVIALTLLTGVAPYKTYYAVTEEEWNDLRDAILAAYPARLAGEEFA